eukprot:4408757-Amphidinium_carterae.1
MLRGDRWVIHTKCQNNTTSSQKAHMSHHYSQTCSKDAFSRDVFVNQPVNDDTVARNVLSESETSGNDNCLTKEVKKLYIAGYCPVYRQGVVLEVEFGQRS